MGIFWNNADRKPLEEKMKREGRLPPGQSLTLKWPVLHYAEVPQFDPETWDFQTSGLVGAPLRLSWKDFLALPRIEVTADFHCVTRWSRFDNRWDGVAFRTIAELTRPGPRASHVMFHSSEGYATNVPLLDLMAGDVLFALNHDGEPLSPEHGGPVRMVVPKLYAWKSAKWVRGLEFLSEDQAGFWEQNGYHMHADPFKEQRFDEEDRSQESEFRGSQQARIKKLVATVEGGFCILTPDSCLLFSSRFQTFPDARSGHS